MHMYTLHSTYTISSKWSNIMTRNINLVPKPGTCTPSKYLHNELYVIKHYDKVYYCTVYSTHTRHMYVHLSQYFHNENYVVKHYDKVYYYTVYSTHTRYVHLSKYLHNDLYVCGQTL